jgi:hypothetical protein
MNGWNGAPGRNRTYNLMVRSHALYPIELRAHRGRITFLNYNGNKIVSPNLHHVRTCKKNSWRMPCALQNRPKTGAGCANRRPILARDYRGLPKNSVTN